MDSTLLRIGIAIAGVVLIAAIYFFGRPRRPGQGRRVGGGFADGNRGDGERIEPTLGEQIADELSASDAASQSELDLGARNEHNDLGKRGDASFEKIVTLYVAARQGEKLRGPDIVVAAEKAGLTYGHMQIFHRLVEGHPERGPIFSVANIMKPGSFDMATIQELETPAIAFFLTLPAPMTALDAWEKMLPTAQRMAELLEGVVLDESRNALGRQRIAHIRDELRGYDRQHEAPPLTKPARW
ncbi:Cell division protein ZipA [Lysobacter dokdonensis DS-58]|uniref:Cell division protein ZipA n=1 Tax=Lysobacter dokdonensis DS-58 TaxID=1300345 RepID=A0A0A2WKJ9_9GAMM|nr:cell division protein ZipA [Lysobacter dokdonensis]KGQ20348.1 Cell division protein ZipA [Lysobacter dokdonensis DS-58]